MKTLTKKQLMKWLTLLLTGCLTLGWAGCSDSGSEMEDAADETADAMEEAADDAADAVDEAADEAEDAADEVSDEY
ncbi:MAG: hypothetical protein PF795_11595 [Kiritimatiellae bacterium]|jgi:predicted  nucleic acid-binding Zn-ribbon protein|nr:hypothetical protein [Kiritimatiellia bacterium]